MTACPACSYDPSAPVLARWEFTIPRDLPSLNERIHNGARGWKYRKTRDAWMSDMMAMRHRHRIATTTCDPTKRRVTLVRLYNGRQQEMDRANIDAKACIDAMVLAGLLKDDNAQWAEIHIKQERGRERGTRVIVEELQ